MLKELKHEEKALKEMLHLFMVELDKTKEEEVYLRKMLEEPQEETDVAMNGQPFANGNTDMDNSLMEMLQNSASMVCFQCVSCSSSDLKFQGDDMLTNIIEAMDQQP